MKLLIDESTSFSFDDKDYIIESSDHNGMMKTFIKGPFLMADVKNRNGRVYPKRTMEIAVDRYQKEYINEKRAMGELNHPANRPLVDIERAAIAIHELKWTNNIVEGKAQILKNPDGDRINSLLDGGIRLGVSSRGMGDMKKATQGHYVVENFVMNAIDVVGTPGSQVCYVNRLVESLEEDWEQNPDGVWVKVLNESVSKKEAVKTMDILSVLFDHFKKI